jgi:hypothetical protein
MSDLAANPNRGGDGSSAWKPSLRREVLRTDLGEPDGINVADELARDRSAER